MTGPSPLQLLAAESMALEPRYASVEDALYAEHSVVTIAITHEWKWTRSTDMLVLVQGYKVGEDVPVDTGGRDAHAVLQR